MKKASDIVKLARDTQKMTTKEWIAALFHQFIELKGDRYYADDQAIVGGIAFFDEQPVTIIGTQKGHDLASNMACNFGSPLPEGYRKAYRLMEQAEKFQRPIITFVNTAGAYCSSESESRGIGEAIAQNLVLMSQLTVPIITIIIGEGGSGGALALAMGNKVYMLEHSMYSVLSPEGFAAILWKDASKSAEAADMMKLTPDSLLDLNIIDGIFQETLGKAKRRLRPKEQVIEDVRSEIKQVLTFYEKLTPEEIKQDRQKRFRKY
ncbi:acetyl-CoA carboxylase carboxyl transferase subunit alpha [Granulicatella sp. zg-ZJ]|uniref:acetyl-CoA carboxylase carboxyl transferase subunit alpha n=1 Tax=unclassified Granulicatella TaxID=2630493 RepID=UPI0013BFF70F|nr:MULTISPECIES: acetyl-CoA carboxylase carboxyl transferase subunit alpha [unclassified Granulicatella]MBS4749467.1 acetyl-CoA carboxylase carboxyl transferase subunit alpha [Carnobacteriaceae bacterium zg-ZUI78]NEW62197.1 acetyl-CoA carboxylase carboxyl transferase subunit alpha [Granulicatella sp. zg-ZJ]NEW66641.1 acetyl-CoA carboxylase carboxyl transferase subunit alpha [Granulicatella sp. zg-84]QMI85036.1 acetyl-CoA carboxylase carboxyl transferase subunit alpha [Carnobacteriaceae bacteriu